MGDVFWISPKNEIVALPGKHIDAVISKPERFGFTTQQLQQYFVKHNEQYGHEGKARAEIIGTLMDQGWVRIRYIPRTDSWTVQLSGSLTKQKKDLIWSFVEGIISGVIQTRSSKYSDIRVLNSQGTILFSGSLEDVLKYSFNESIKKITFKLFLLESY